MGIQFPLPLSRYLFLYLFIFHCIDGKALLNLNLNLNHANKRLMWTTPFFNLQVTRLKVK